MANYIIASINSSILITEIFLDLSSKKDYTLLIHILPIIFNIFALRGGCKMAKTIDPITQKKLVLIKQLYRQAVLQTSSLVIMNRIMAIITFDLTIEASMKCVVDEFETGKNPERDFPSLIKQCDDLLNKNGLKPLPDKAHINHIHSIRNDCQHKAKYPNETDVSDCRTYTRDFLQTLLLDIWGVDFEQISIADAIQNDEIKQLLLKAEVALTSKNYLEAIEISAFGLEKALGKVKKVVVGQLPHFIKGIVVSGSHSIRAETDAEDTLKAIKRMQSTLLFESFDVKFSDYQKIKGLSGEIMLLADGSYRCMGFRKENPDADDARFVLSCCTDAILRIEEKVGCIEKPFGRELNQW